MSENIVVPSHAGKTEKYEALAPQLEALFSGETDLIANLANMTAILKEIFGFFWVGFYLVKNEQLVLGPFQGPLACTRIGYGKGVCGKAWETMQTQLIPDVEAFPGHIACSAASRSEIVVPLLKSGKVMGVLDIDSDKLADFDQIDQKYLEKLVSLIPVED
ncbi:GAF domain-containing protein [Cyclobacterium sp.]|uniref:GAF domain-containing protein n=1 Tax=Cyclobacterium sp. TaxID=1966343 RepID=UPI0019A503FA|nr:GAF domain-containing protein [Cyclobacterium sp.]MBD3626846.1 GAF domain-containing protein [Cyclobacterium sp.]